MRMKLTIIGLLLAVALLLAACGGENAAEVLASDAPESIHAKPLDLIATNYKFDQQTYTINQGEAVKFTLVNEEGTHSLSIKGLGVELKDGQSMTVLPNKAGTYNIICTLPCGSGHSTMRAKLIVE